MIASPASSNLDKSPSGVAASPVDKSPDKIRSMFAGLAERYDLANHVLSCNFDHYWRWRTTRLAPPKGTGPILDVCTGTGDLALAYWKRSKPGQKVVGADFCPEMLSVAHRKAERAKVGDRIEWVEADATRLPFAANEFEIVSVAFGLRNVVDTDAGLREMTRVCKSGGTVAVLEFSTPTWQPMKAIYGWYFRNLLPRIGSWIAKSDSASYGYLPESVGQFPQGDALVTRLELAGLVDVTYRPMTFGVATLYLGQKP